MEDKKINALFCLTFEITRRCNMNCDFCSRGKAQNIDITPTIIDKALDEVKDYYINSLRLFGGEPFLNADMIEYLVNAIIKKNITINTLSFFTNGTIIDEKIKQSLCRLSAYIDTIKIKSKTYDAIIANEFNVESVSKYYSNDFNNIFIIVSDWLHDNCNTSFNDFKNFYSNNNYKIEVINYNDYYKDNNKYLIYLSGNALINHQKLLNKNIDVFRDVRTPINEYNFIKDNSNAIHIQKTLCISANGNVFAGTSMAYDKVDAKPMFNILDCNNDFIVKVYNWCWEHPLTYLMNKFNEIESSKKWLIENGYSITNEQNDILSNNNVYINRFEYWVKFLHNKYEFLTLAEAQEIAMYLVCYEHLKSKKLPNRYLYAFLSVSFPSLEYLLADYINIHFVSSKIEQLIKQNTLLLKQIQNQE